MANKIDLSKSVYELVNEYPDLISIMKDLGFDKITEPGMLATVGRFMTIQKGAGMKKISMEKVEEILRMHGYEV